MKKIILLFALVLIIGCKSDKNNEEERSPSSERAASRDPELNESISRGAKLYNNFCATCHLANGEGIPNVFPPLNNSDWLTDKRKETIRAVKYGVQGPITVNGVKYDNLMPDMGLSDEEVRNVLNYVFQAWDNNVEPPISPEEVQAINK